MKNKSDLDILLLALDSYELDEIVKLLKDEERFFDKYLFEVEDGYFSVESARYDSIENILLLNKFIFGAVKNPQVLFRSGETKIFDLTDFKSKSKNPGTKYPATDELDCWYQDWIKESNRENTMDEYGQLIGVIGYIQRNQDKKHLLLIVQPVDA